MAIDIIIVFLVALIVTIIIRLKQKFVDGREHDRVKAYAKSVNRLVVGIAAVVVIFSSVYGICYFCKSQSGKIDQIKTELAGESFSCYESCSSGIFGSRYYKVYRLYFDNDGETVWLYYTTCGIGELSSATFKFQYKCSYDLSRSLVRGNYKIKLNGHVFGLEVTDDGMPDDIYYKS